MEARSPKLYTADQVRALDADAIEQQGISAKALMERAGATAAEHARAVFPDARHWLVVTGGGNNAGDGFVVARLAAEQGIKVTVCALKPVTELRGEAAAAAERWLESGGSVAPWPPATADYDLGVDALLGTGLDRPVAGAYRDAIEHLNRSAMPILALDLPSGLSADTGSVLGTAVRAALTVTFVGRKRGLYTADGPDHCGRVVADNLGTTAPTQIRDRGGQLLEPSLLARALPPRPRNAHKGMFGRVLIAGGQPGMGGAVCLAGTAALRSGAGTVTLGTAPAHAPWIGVARPELMVQAIEDGNELSRLAEVADVLAIGPGLGSSGWSRDVLSAALRLELPLVADADALRLMEPETGHEQPRILTPHPGEAAAMLGVTTGEVQRDRFAAAASIARRWQAVVILKGCGSVIADPDGRYAVVAAGNPGMATAGSGDVLTGVVAALLAQGLPAWEAARTAALAHAVAGDRAAEHGMRGMLAGDIVDALPGVLSS